MMYVLLHYRTFSSGFCIPSFSAAAVSMFTPQQVPTVTVSQAVVGSPPYGTWDGLHSNPDVLSRLSPVPPPASFSPVNGSRPGSRTLTGRPALSPRNASFALSIGSAQSLLVPSHSAASEEDQHLLRDQVYKSSSAAARCAPLSKLQK